MTRLRLVLAVCGIAFITLVVPSAQTTPQQGAAKPPGGPIGGTLTPAKAAARG